MKRSILFLTAFVNLIATSAKGDSCRDILEFGLRDRYQVTSLSEYHSHLKQVLEWDYDELKRHYEQRDREGDLGVIVYGIYASLSGSESKKREDFHQLKQSLNLQTDALVHSRDFLSIYSETTNPSIVAAWETCMNNRAEVFSCYSGDPFGEFTLMLTFKPHVRAEPKIRIEAVSLENLWINLDDVSIAPKRFIESGRYFQKFHRIDPNRPASILISVESDSSQPDLKLEAYAPPVPPAPEAIPWNVPAGKEDLTITHASGDHSWADPNPQILEGNARWELRTEGDKIRLYLLASGKMTEGGSGDTLYEVVDARLPMRKEFPNDHNVVITIPDPSAKDSFNDPSLGHRREAQYDLPGRKDVATDNGVIWRWKFLHDNNAGAKVELHHKGVSGTSTAPAPPPPPAKPAYEAAPIGYGDISALPDSPKHWFWICIIGTVLVILLFLVIKRQRQGSGIEAAT